MTDMIHCPACGEANPASQRVCRNCQAPLATTDDASIHPGQAPTKKETAELEPILPQWLKDARNAAKQADSQGGSSDPQFPPGPPAAAKEDLLAGLQSQSGADDEEEVPDWLANITGASPKSKKTPAESSEVRWVEVGETRDFQQDEQAGDSDLPPWLANLQSQEAQPEIDELAGWPQADSSQPPQPAPAFVDDLPDLFADDTPDWLKQMSADAEGKSESLLEQTPSDAPDWLSGLRPSGEHTQSAEPALGSGAGTGESDALDLSSVDIPEWMKGPTEMDTPAGETIPAWLNDETSPPQNADLPAWLSSEDTLNKSAEPAEQAQDHEAPAQGIFSDDLPDWLKAAAPQASIFDAPADPSASELSDLPAMPPTAGTSQPDEETEDKTETAKGAPFEAVPAFPPDIEADAGLDDLFTDMPDWLSNSLESASPAAAQPADGDALAPGELPSWVQAMRPLETEGAMPSLSSDQALESRGPLAGLHGVLPAMPGFAPTSKPKAHSIKLNASGEQLAHAEILEQLLAAETAPVPIETLPSLRASRGLRWFLAAALLIFILVPISLRTQIFSMPQGEPHETRDALLIMQSIPADARLLVAFDYEPARAAEMEAAAAPFFDNLLTLKPPRLTFVATNETGAALAERFISGPLAGHNYQSGVHYLNLGYLPGGQLGIRAFAQHPSRTAPLDVWMQPAWTSALLEGVSTLEQFTAMILITDNADAARVWVEQTESLRGSAPFIIVASAQAAPMIQPYYDSGQVNGIVSGLYGGAIFETRNAGRPGTARSYWDAYSLAMLLAMSLVLGGGLWNFAQGMRERAETGGAK